MYEASETQLQGGTFTGNTATEAGGGVYAGNRAVSLWYNISVTGNTLTDGTDNNLYFENTKNPLSCYRLSSDARIGITSEKEPNCAVNIVLTDALKTTGVNPIHGTADNFFSDDPAYEIAIDEASTAAVLKYTDAAFHHDWSDEVTYTWAEDYSQVTARRVCTRDETHVETENADAVCEVVKMPEEEAKGQRRYSASFDNPGLGAVEVVVEDIPAINEMNALILPAALTAIDEEAFMDNNDLEAVIIPDSCESIGSAAFAGCGRLIYVRIPARFREGVADIFGACDDVIFDWQGD